MPFAKRFACRCPLQEQPEDNCTRYHACRPIVSMQRRSYLTRVLNGLFCGSVWVYQLRMSDAAHWLHRVLSIHLSGCHMTPSIRPGKGRQVGDKDEMEIRLGVHCEPTWRQTEVSTC